MFGTIDIQYIYNKFAERVGGLSEPGFSEI